MGFIENLRRQIEQEVERDQSEAQARVRRQKMESERFDELRFQQEQAEKQKELKIRQERGQAEAFLRQSEFPRLAKELSSFVPDMKLTYVPVEINNGLLGMVRRVVSQRSNDFVPEENIAGISLSWPIGKRNVRVVPKHWSGEKERDSPEYKKWEEKIATIVVACNREGTIEIIGNSRSIRLSQLEWSRNSDLQERSLGAAYVNPAISYIPKDDQPYYPTPYKERSGI